MDRIKDIIKDINSCANDGYSVEELKGEDRIEMNSYIFAIANTETAFDNIQFVYDADKTIVGKIKSEHLEEIWESVYQPLISDAVNLLYSLIDGNEVYDEV